MSECVIVQETEISKVDGMNKDRGVNLFAGTMLTMDQIASMIGEKESYKEEGGNHGFTEVYSFQANR